MGFAEIEQRRARARIDQQSLCRRAQVHPTTYSRLKNRPGAAGAYVSTLDKLARALDALIAERQAALAERQARR